MINLFVTINAYILYAISLVGINKKTEEFNLLGILLVGLYVVVAGTVIAASLLAVLAFIFYLPLFVFMYE